MGVQYRVRNDAIRAAFQIEDHATTACLYKMEWKGHIPRMSPNGIWWSMPHTWITRGCDEVRNNQKYLNLGKGRRGRWQQRTVYVCMYRNSRKGEMKTIFY